MNSIKKIKIYKVITKSIYQIIRLNFMRKLSQSVF